MHDGTFYNVIVVLANRYADGTESNLAQLNEAVNKGAIAVVCDL